MRHVSVVSAIALMAFGSIGVAGAQTYDDDESSSNPKPRVTGEQSNFCADNPDECQPRKMKQKQTEEVDIGKNKKQKQAEEVDTGKKMKQAQGDWRYDGDRHERRRSKDARFRFFLGGYWYPEPYWQGYGLYVNPRVSCGEGRGILRDRGFYRVRTIECQGRTYTYLGRRDGKTFRVLLSARSGRVVDMDRV